MLNDEMIQSDILRRLTEKKQELEETLARLMETQKDSNGHLSNDGVADETDNAQWEISALSNYGLINRKVKELKKVDNLISKVARHEDLGICEDCGDPIPTERLLIVPETTLCVDCQHEQERFEKSRNGGPNAFSGFKGKSMKEWKESVELDSLDEEHYEVDYDSIPDVELIGPESEENPEESQDDLGNNAMQSPPPKEQRPLRAA